jgi:hypothetical protein
VADTSSAAALLVQLFFLRSTFWEAYPGRCWNIKEVLTPADYNTSGPTMQITA